MSQIALPLPISKTGDPDRIVIGCANAHIVDALGAAANWPFHTAVLTGPRRSGKSLIGRWAAAQDIAVIDNAEARDETEIFHSWNASQEGGSRAGQKLLLIANAMPWEIQLPDLRSRLGGSLQLEIGQPDDAMAAALLETLADQRSLSLAEGAAEYLVPRAPRGFASIEALVDAIDRISLERQAPATMSVWRAAIEALQGPEQRRLF
jgi:chromosomal replication initiation ATPase DnaA